MAPPTTIMPSAVQPSAFMWNMGSGVRATSQSRWVSAMPPCVTYQSASVMK